MEKPFFTFSYQTETMELFFFVPLEMVFFGHRLAYAYNNSFDSETFALDTDNTCSTHSKVGERETEKANSQMA